MDRRTALQCLALFGAAPLLAQDKPKQLSPDELEKLLKNTRNLFFLDVREPKEIAETGSIKGYVNIPLGQLESRLSEIPKNQPIVTGCSHGRRAGKAAELLTAHGYQVIGACALLTWKEQGRPVVYPKAKDKEDKK